MNAAGEAREEPGSGPDALPEYRKGPLSMSMRRKVTLSGLAYFSLLLVAVAVASPALLGLLAGARVPEIAPVASFYLPHVQDASISPGGDRIAVATTAGVEIRGLENGELERRLGFGRIDRVSWSPDGDMVGAVDDEAISVWSLEEGRTICRIPYPHFAFAWFPDSRRIATISRNRESLIVWDVQRDILLHEIKAPEAQRICDTVAVSESSIALGWWKEETDTATVELRDAETYQPFRSHEMALPSPACYVGRRALYGMAWSAGGTLSFLLADCPGTSHEWYALHLWHGLNTMAFTVPYPIDIETGEDGLWISSYCWSPSGLSLGMVFNMSNSLGVYDVQNHSLRSGGLQGETNSWGSYNHAAGFTPDGERLGVALTQREMVQIFDVETMESVVELTEYGIGVDGVDLSPDGSFMAILEGRGSVRLVDLDSGRSTELFRVEQLFGGDLRFSDEGRELLVWTDQMVAVWDMEKWNLDSVWSIPESEEEVKEGPSSGDHPWQVSRISPDNSQIAIMRVGSDRRIRTIEVRNARSGEVIRYKEIPSITADMGKRMGGSIIDWSPDQELVGFSDYSEIFVWNLSDDAVTRICAHTNVSSFAFHPGMDILATVSRDEETVLWDMVTKEEIVKLNQALYGPVFSPDGSMILGGSGIYNSTNLGPLYRLAATETSKGMVWNDGGTRVVTLVPFYGPISIYEIPGPGR